MASRSSSNVDHVLARATTRRRLLGRAAALGMAIPVAGAVGVASVRRAAAQDTAGADLSGELVFWHGLGTEADLVTNTVLPAWQQQYPNVSIEVLQVPFDQLQNKYNTEASAGGGPDVLLGPLDWIGQYVEADIVRPVDELGGDDFRAGYTQAATDLFSRDGQLYAVPQNINGVGLYYNRQLVQTPPQTTDELLAVAAEIGGQGGNSGFGVFPQFYNNAGFFHGFGGQSLTEDAQSGFASPGTIAWLTFMQTLASSPGIFQGQDQNAVESLFREGTLGMMINGPWFLQNATAGIGAENVGVAVLPQITPSENAPARPFVGGTGVYVNSNLDDDQAQLAFEFARWLSTDGTRPLVEQAGQIPASTAVEPPADDRFAQTWRDQYEQGVAIPNDPMMETVFRTADDMLGKVFRGEAPPEQAANEAAETINRAGG
ncbi:MAG: extracellular solute-binding protein [Chloroflexota bacterium]|nr:extracellular solute-binding protein [Chloroflexota bacterium]